MRASLPLLFALVVGCASPTPPAEAGAAIRPGEGIGDVRLEMTLAEVRALIGEPQGALVSNRIGFARFDGELEIVFTSPEADALTDDALVLGIGASEGADVSGPAVPGATRAEVEAALGPAPDAIGEIEYYPEGVSVEYDGDRVFRVGVTLPYERRPDPPPMSGAGS